MGKNLKDVPQQTGVEKKLQEEIDKRNEFIMQSYDESLKYNENISNHDEKYENFVPLEKVLIRVFRRLPVVTSIGDTQIIVDTNGSADYAKVMRQAATGQNFTAKQVPTEFKLSTKAVVVAVPSFEQRIKKGDVVCIDQLVTQAVAFDGGEEIIYQYWFVHPDSNKAVPPHNPSDSDYGYALVPNHVIKGFL
jgi:hypothetical protein